MHLHSCDFIVMKMSGNQLLNRGKNMKCVVKNESNCCNVNCFHEIFEKEE